MGDCSGLESRRVLTGLGGSTPSPSAMKKKQMNRNEYSLKHTLERLKERYNLNAVKADYDYLCDAIKHNAALLIDEEKSSNQEVYEIVFKNERLILVWNTEREVITTALPKSGKFDLSEGEC